MIVGLSKNEYGTDVSVHVCSDCGNRFTVCPPAGEDWGGCLAETCASYDINRDVGALVVFGGELRRRSED